MRENIYCPHFSLTYAGYEGPGRSPDRADVMVWAMTELLKPAPAEPKVRRP